MASLKGYNYIRGLGRYVESLLKKTIELAAGNKQYGLLSLFCFNLLTSGKMRLIQQYTSEG